MFGKKKVAIVESNELSALRIERRKVLEALGHCKAEDEAYDRLLKRSKDLDDLIAKEEGRVSPPKDKISKSDLLVVGSNLLMFGLAFIPELKGHVVLRSPLRRLTEKPRLFGRNSPGPRK